MIEKMNPFEQIVETMKAFTDTDIFYKLRKQSTGSKFLVALITSIIACLLTFMVGGFKLAQSKTWEEIIGAIPEFIYSNGQMSCEEKYDQLLINSYIMIDTDVDAWTMPQYDSTKQGVDITSKVTSISSNPAVEQMMFISKYNIVLIRGVGATASYQEMEWSEFFGVFGIQSLSKSQIQSGYKGVIMKMATILFFFAIPVRLLGLFFFALLLTIVALIINAVQKADEDFSTLYWISFYMQSAFMMIVALLKVLVTGKSSIWVSACLIYFIVIMTRVLKNGAPMENSFVGNRGPAPSTSMVNDDFEQFMGGTTDARDVQERSDYNPYAKQQEEFVPNTGRSPFDVETEPAKEQTGQTSGLSLKKDD